TYHRYCNAYRGYNQAFTPTKKSGKEFYPKPFLNNVPRLILAGQWMSPPGGLPAAAIQGKFAIPRILQREGRSSKV
ncbi:MAG: NAD(P)/FAD-dependent oxidoreductase, partial [Firmicutes bacterium]|nr:NAD(P)/FAD-dependent oxidoreductase [Bacillota bacterium]